jgi:ABC-type amino acid transport substrate-binding protein
MRASLLIASLLCAALCGVAAQAAPVRILVEDAASPWSNRAGEGYANDLVRAAFAAAGVHAELAVVPYARCKALVIQGAATACFSMSAAPEFEQRVRFADKALFSVTPRFYFNARQPLAARALADLAPGTRVGIVHGYEYPPFVAQLALRGIVLERGRSDVANLQKLAAGRLDAALVMTDEMRSEELIQRQAGVGDVRFAFAAAPMGSFIGFSVRHREGEAQRRLFNQGFRIISANGTRQAIAAKWKLRCARVCPE